MDENTEKLENKFVLFLKIFLITILLVGFSFYFYMHGVEPKRIKVYEQAIINSNLPDSFTGLKIAHFSDIHYGTTINEKELKNVVKKINELHADVLVFTGDLFDEAITIQDKQKEEMIDALKDTNASLKKYAVLGNEDYANKELFIEIMASAGFCILDNTHDFLYYEGNTPILFIGTSSSLENETNIDSAIQIENNDLEYFKIWLHHEPIIFDTLLDKNIRPNILLTGHTMGGLINIPFYGYLLKQDGVSKYTKNYYHKKRVSMYISNGLGTSKYPLRFHNTPSISLYRLYNK